jgi:hypothetical protein
MPIKSGPIKSGPIKSRSKAAILLALGLTMAGAALAAPKLSSSWEIGPVIRGRNYSVGMPLSPTPVRSGWRFEFPYPDEQAGHVHYITRNIGSLAGKRRIVVRYRIDAAPSTRFLAREFPDYPAAISLYFQRRGDDWSAKGRYGDYRWYSPHAGMIPIAPGLKEFTIRLDDPDWSSVNGQRAADRSRQFAAALADGGRIGFTFGNGARRGHGVYATSPARFTLIDFRVE